MPLSYDATAGAVASGTSSGNASHALGSASGNDRIVLIWCFSNGNTESDTAITACTYNGSSTGVVLVGTYTTGTGFNLRITLYRVLDAALPSSSGSYNAACTSNNGQVTGVCAISYDGADQSDPFGGEYQIGRLSAVNPINDSVTTDTVDSVVIDACAADLYSGSATTTQSGQVERYDYGGTLTMLSLVSTRPSATTGSWTLGWNFSGSPNRSQHYLIELHAADTGSGEVIIETTNLAQGNAGGTTSHTLTTNANRGVIVLIDVEGTSQATGVTYNSVAMTQVVSSTSSVGLGNASSMWFILDANLPAGGASYNVSVSGLSSAASVTVVELNNVAQVIPSGAAVDTNETGDVATSSTTVTAANDYSISVGALGFGNDTASFDNPPSGTGTWTRLFEIYGPPTLSLIHISEPTRPY